MTSARHAAGQPEHARSMQVSVQAQAARSYKTLSSWAKARKQHAAKSRLPEDYRFIDGPPLVRCDCGHLNAVHEDDGCHKRPYVGEQQLPGGIEGIGGWYGPQCACLIPAREVGK